MSDQQQQSIPVYEAREPSEDAKRVMATFDDMESKQLDNLNDAGKTLIERIATFLGVLFGLSILNGSFPPSFLKNNTPVKALLFAALACYLLAILMALWATQVRFFNRYIYNMTRAKDELTKMIKSKVNWLRFANLFFALGTVLLAILLLAVVWNV
ncbi:MAG TPA: hypothetical protein VFA41_10050 [Ktedonobacteraceae bacterium]|jgi:hypothetical protein|nr:hypothetical protein [Ktedonobacteraceae bacterium]